MTRAAFLLVLSGLVLAPMAWAQPAPTPGAPLETVIVTAPRLLHSGVTPGAIAHDFVKSFAMPSLLTQQIARWKTGICPVFLGVTPQNAGVMDYRLRQTAIQAGAPLKEKGCEPNLTIVYTPQPQTYLDALRAKSVDALGYHGATTVTHPIQAWYVTGMTDIRGRTFLDKDATMVLDTHAGEVGPPKVTVVSTNTAAVTNVGGWRAHPDVTSDLLYVTIIIDADQTTGYSFEEIADYVTMLALSRSEDYGDCQLMPSIANLLTPNCDDKLKSEAITASDIAYLKGVYKMDPGADLQVQQNQIAAEMQKSLGGQ